MIEAKMLIKDFILFFVKSAANKLGTVLTSRLFKVGILHFDKLIHLIELVMTISDEGVRHCKLFEVLKVITYRWCLLQYLLQKNQFIAIGWCLS